MSTEGLEKYLPNTTQIPNSLLDTEMEKMKDTELRVVLIVARKTLGWLLDFETGRRKKEDWIAKSQLMKFSGRSNKALANALKKCIDNDWIEARDKNGGLLDTPEKRRGLGQGGKIFYRLGKKFLPSAEECKKETANQEGDKKYPAKSTHYKTKYIQKKESSSEKYKGMPEEAMKKYKQGFKPSYDNLEMRWSKRDWWVLPAEGGQWKEFGGSAEDIDWK